MGSLYRTTAPAPIDYMYRLNTPLMEKVLTTNEGYITNQLDQASQLGQLANYSHVIGDEEDASKIRQGYNDEIESITKAIRSNPSDWRNQVPNITNLKTKLVNDYTSGAISKQLGNYNRRQAAFDAADKQVELWNTSGGTKGVSPERAAAYKNNWDENFTKTGYDPNNPNSYNIYKGGEIMNNIDVKKTLADGLDKIKADKESHYYEDEYGNGWYLNKISNNYERITPDKILQVASDNVSPGLMSYLANDQRVGLINGVYYDKGSKDENGNDVSGKFIQPYKYEPVPRNPEEDKKIATMESLIAKTNGATKQDLTEKLNNYKASLDNRRQVKFNNDSYLAPIFRGLSNTYSYENTTSGNDLTYNPKMGTIYTQQQENNRAAIVDKRTRDIADQVDKRTRDLAGDTIAWDKYKWDNPQPKTTGIGSTLKPSAIPVTPVESSVSKMATRGFEDFNTITPTNKKVPVLSNEGLSSDIERFKTRQDQILSNIKDIDKQLSNPSITIGEVGQLNAQKEALQRENQDVSAQLGLRRVWYKNSTNAALANTPVTGLSLTPQQVEIYKQHANDIDGSKQIAEINKLRQQYPDVITGTTSTDVGANDVNVYGLSPQVKAATDKYNEYLGIKKAVDSGRQKFLESLRSDILNSDAIQVGDKENKIITDMMMQNPQGLTLYDQNYKSTAGIPIKSGFLSKFNKEVLNGAIGNLGFEGTDDLSSYMRLNGVKMKVEQIGNSSKLGNGNSVAKVYFEDPKGNIPQQPYYIVLSDEIQRGVSNVFKGHKNPEVAKIGYSIGDEQANAIRKQLANAPSINRALKNDGGKEPYTFTIYVNAANGKRVPLSVTKITEGEQDHYSVSGLKNGKEVPLPRIQGGKVTDSTGIFNGGEDLIQTLLNR
jgi:hypothetical protein